MHEPTTLALEKGDISLFQALDGLSHPCLILHSGTAPGHRFDLEQGERVIGRGSEADVAVEGRGISRRHAALSVDASSVELRDLGSANSTFVNDTRVTEPVTLKDGDVVRLANVVLRFHDRRSLDALLHDRLYRLATVDAGTGVFNRRYTQEALTLEVARSRRAGTALSLVSCDLDGFKGVNNRHGHAAGDRVLKDCAALLRRLVRGTDTIGRWGGEEFVILARATPFEHACVLAERLRAGVEAQAFVLEGDTVPVLHRQTLSLGVATLGDDMADEHDLLAVADRRLYAAKRAGRNRVVSSDVR